MKSLTLNTLRITGAFSSVFLTAILVLLLCWLGFDFLSQYSLLTVALGICIATGTAVSTMKNPSVARTVMLMTWIVTFTAISLRFAHLNLHRQLNSFEIVVLSAMAVLSLAIFTQFAILVYRKLLLFRQLAA